MTDSDEHISPHEKSESDICSDLVRNALTKHSAGEIPAAAALYRAGLAYDPTHSDALHMLGVATLQQDDPDGACTLLLRARMVQPPSARLDANMASCLHILQAAGMRDLENGQLVRGAARLALVLAERRRRAEPEADGLHSVLAAFVPRFVEEGFKAIAIRAYRDALAAVRPVLALEPGNVAANLIVGFCKANMRAYGGMEEAVRRLRYVIAMEPANPLAWRSLALTGTEMRHMREGLHYLYRYACIDEEPFRILPDLAGAYLFMRDTAAFQFIEQNMRTRGAPLPRFSVRDPHGNQSVHVPLPWNGEPIPDRTLLITVYAAIGDIVMFARYIVLAAAMCRTVYLMTHPYLEKLLGSLVGTGNVVINPTGFAAPPDYRCDIWTIMSVMTVDYPRSVPAPVPYLAISADRIGHWQRLRAAPGPTVGIVWQSNGPERCIPFGFFEGLVADHPDVRFVVVHHKLDDPSDTDLVERAMRRFPGRLIWPREADRPEGLYDTAAILSNLDLLITTCTGPAHIAGALGKPFWVALQIPGSWMWVNETNAMPWYPTGRLFRQTVFGYWGDVFREISNALHAFTGNYRMLRYE